MPSFVVAVMVAIPTFSAVTVPSDAVATSLSELDQVMLLSVAFSGNTVATKTSVSPTVIVTDVLSSVTLSTDTGLFSFGPSFCGGVSVVLHDTNIKVIEIRSQQNSFLMPFIVLSFLFRNKKMRLQGECTHIKYFTLLLELLNYVAPLFYHIFS